MTALLQDAQTLITSVCRQFSQATGWTMAFAPIEGDFASLEMRYANAADCCWFAEVNDGREPLGLLHLAPSEHIHPPCSFVQATDLADTVADLVVRLVTADRRLELRNHDMSTLVHLGMAIPAQENLAWALTQVLKAAVQLTTSRGAAFFLLNPDTTRLKLRAVYQLGPQQVPHSERSLEESEADRLALSRAPAFLSVPAPEPTEPPPDAPRRPAPANVTPIENPADWLPDGYRSGLCVAVQSETLPIGTLWVYDRRGRDYNDRDRHVLQSISMQIAAVLERVALLRHSDDHERISRELRTASEASPGSRPHVDLPPDDRYEIAANCASCYELGGDLCELMPIDGDQIAIAIGDASGNSIPAAMIMSAVRGAVRTHAAGADGVAYLMGRLNTALTEITRSHQFMSLCYGVYDAAKRTFLYSNAGHPMPLLVRGGKIHSLASHGLLLGVMRDVVYDTSLLQLQPDDLLVCFTDGISEARSRSQQMFRSEGIADAVLHCIPGTAEAVLASVWRRVESHMAGGEPGDDRTLLVLRVR
jgi:sigma-B regulation protein RsbU (phosphoserine phosphatase)